MIGNGISLLSSLGSRATTKIRSESYLDEVNGAFFNPRGLAVTICSTADMSKIIRHPHGNEITLPQIESPTDLDMKPMTRRYLALQGYVCEVTFDNIPPASVPDSVLEKLSAKQVQRQTQSQEEKIKKERQKEVEKLRKESVKDDYRRKDKHEKKNTGNRQERGLLKLEKRFEKLELDAESIDLKARKEMIKEKGKSKGESEVEAKRQKDLRKLNSKREKLERKRDEILNSCGSDSDSSDSSS